VGAVDDADVDVEVWLVLLELDVVELEPESEDDMLVSDVEVLPEVVDVAEEEVELTEVTVAVSVELGVGGAAPAPITGAKIWGDRFLIRRFKFA